MREEEQEQKEGKSEYYRSLSSTNKLNLHENAIINDLSDIAVHCAWDRNIISKSTYPISQKYQYIHGFPTHDFLPFFISNRKTKKCSHKERNQ